MTGDTIINVVELSKRYKVRRMGDTDAESILANLPISRYSTDKNDGCRCSRFFYQYAIFLEMEYIISAIFLLLTGKSAFIHSRIMPTVPFAIYS